MKAFCRCIFFIGLFICSVNALTLQSSTPEAALEELVNTDKLEVALKHLPLTVQQAVDQLSPKEKEQISTRLVVRKQMEKEGISIHKRDDGTAWEAVSEKDGIVGSVKVKNSFASGTEAFLVLEFTETKNTGENESGQKQKKEPHSTEALVSMRLQEGEWRVTGFGEWEHK